MNTTERPIIVQKYGGSSLATAEMVRRVATKICRCRDQGSDLVVVVSAMGDTTDTLISLARQVVGDGGSREPREMDTLLSTGELVSATLVAMAIRSMGYDVVSLSGVQAGIRTDAIHGSARIASINPSRIYRELGAGRVVVVAGFQGLAETEDVTTLGRGGSDTTAVALAAQLSAARCEIYTDVDGIYTTDPRLVPEARKLPEVQFGEMLELASLGAKMNPRSIELGAVYGVPVLVASAFDEVPGTLIHGPAQHGSKSMEIRNAVTAVATERGVTRIAVRGMADRPGLAAEVFEAIAAKGINVDVILANDAPGKAADLTFTVAQADFNDASRIVFGLNDAAIETANALAKVSIVGTGMQNSPGYAAKMFRVLADADVNIELITTSEISITCIIPERSSQLAAEKLSEAFETPIVRSEEADPSNAAESPSNASVAGVAVDRSVGRVTVRGVEDRPGVAAALFEPLAAAGISVDLVVQTAAGADLTDMAFTVSEAEGQRAKAITQSEAGLSFQDIIWDDGLAKVSVVGSGIQFTPGQAAKAFRALADIGINIRAITTADIRITCLIDADDVKPAAQALHRVFNLAAIGR